MTAQVAADLRAAADVLERDGWAREAYITNQGNCCTVGAVMKAVIPDAGPGTDLTEVENAQYARMGDAAKALGNTLGLPVGHFWDGPITFWNDAPGRTADEVIVALRTAADRAEADGA